MLVPWQVAKVPGKDWARALHMGTAAVPRIYRARMGLEGEGGAHQDNTPAVGPPEAAGIRNGLLSRHHLLVR